VSNPPHAQVQANAHAKPRLALRVGVTGARILDTDQLDRLEKQTRGALAKIRDEVSALAADPAVLTHYAATGTSAQTPLLRLLSPIALGSDRLVAKAAAELGYQLYVPMPFPQVQYELDFQGTTMLEKPRVPRLTAAEDLAEFHDLLKQADGEWVALDGARGEDPGNDLRNCSYEAVGHFVVRNSDILIAIWDGKGAAGRGGTEQIVHYAASVGVPVWWIHATADVEPVWIADIQDLRDPLQPENPENKLLAYLRQQILPQAPVTRNRNGMMERFATLGLSASYDPANEYFNETPLPEQKVWTLYRRMMEFVSGAGPAWKEPRKPQDDASAYWFRIYEPADARAGEYAARYRSSYVWVFFLANLSLLFAGLSSLFHGREIFASRFFIAASASAELLCLALIWWMASSVARGSWHERSIEYRLLAELCRKQQVLAPLGRALSFGAVQRFSVQTKEADETPSETGQPASVAATPHGGDRSLWVSWLFMAYQRAAVLPHGDIAEVLPNLANESVSQDLVDEQLNYHRARGLSASRASEYFENLGIQVFTLLLICVAVKIFLTEATSYPFAGFVDWTTAILGLLGIILPAVSAASIGIRSYAEWQLLAGQSNHMLQLLTLARKRIARINLKRPMASQDLGTEADAVASLMLQDLEGWQRLFRVKIIEPP
jgi:hypothetical protein